MRPKQSKSIGQVTCPLVLGIGGSTSAVCIRLTVEAITNDSTQPPAEAPVVIVAEGSVPLDHKLIDHASAVVAQLAERLLQAPGAGLHRFVVSVSPIDALCCHAVEARIAGFSLDAAIVIATVSDALNIPVPQDMAITGQVDPAGRIVMVRAMPEKIAAVEGNPSIQRLLIPGPDDGSMERLAPGENQRIEGAIARARPRLQIITAGDIDELCRQVFELEDVVLSSLRSGTFSRPAVNGGEQAINRAIAFLRQGEMSVFWEVLGNCLQEDEIGRAGGLLDAFAAFHLKQRQYPRGIGASLKHLLGSLPTWLARRLRRRPLLTLKQCLSLGILADDAELEDVLLLIDVFYARAPRRQQKAEETDDASAIDDEVGRVVREVGLDVVRARILLPLDGARASFAVDEVTSGSHEQFLEVVSAFYRHLAWRSGLCSLPLDDDLLTADALRLVEDAFSRLGGIKAAEAEARQGVQGGVRLVLDRMTDQLKEDLQYRHIDRVLKEAIDPFDPRQRVQFIAALMKRMGGLLPADIRARPAEDFAEHRDQLVRSYVQSLDRITQVFRGV